LSSISSSSSSSDYDTDDEIAELTENLEVLANQTEKNKYKHIIRNNKINLPFKVLIDERKLKNFVSKEFKLLKKEKCLGILRHESKTQDMYRKIKYKPFSVVLNKIVHKNINIEKDNKCWSPLQRNSPIDWSNISQSYNGSALLATINGGHRAVNRKMTDLVPEKRYAITDFCTSKGQLREKLNLSVYDDVENIEFYITIGDDFLEFFENPTYVTALKKKTEKIGLRIWSLIVDWSNISLPFVTYSQCPNFSLVEDKNLVEIPETYKSQFIALGSFLGKTLGNNKEKISIAPSSFGVILQKHLVIPRYIDRINVLPMNESNPSMRNIYCGFVPAKERVQTTNFIRTYLKFFEMYKKPVS